MNHVTWQDRLRYRFDNYMSKGTAALIGGLSLISLVLIVLAGLILWITRFTQEGEQPLSFFEAAWEALMRTLDAGTMGGDSGWGYRLVMFGVTVGGVFVISSLIGVLSNGLEDRIEELRKGRSRVIESGHTAILGWSSQVFSIISELVIANKNQKQSCIVVLGEADKVEMEDAIRRNVGPTGKTRVVCRSGSPIQESDLELVSLAMARSIIALSPASETPDSDVIKTLLAVTNNPTRRIEPYHIVAELHDPKNLEVARLISPTEIEFILTGDIIARIIAQTSLQSGLSILFTDLLDFEGDEIYFQAEPSLVGKTFGEILSAYEDSAVLGLYSPSGTSKLNPPMDTRLQPGDQVIAVSEDDDTVRLSGQVDLGVQEEAICLCSPAKKEPERALILGWNWRAPVILNELERYVQPESVTTVAADDPDVQDEIARFCPQFHNQSVDFHLGDTTDRRFLDSLDIPSYHHVILLCYSDKLDVQSADARTLVTLLHLRDIRSKAEHPFSIVSELLDIHNRNLAEVTQADDFIVSDKLVSLMLAQVSENKALNAVFEDLFNAEGSEIYLKPAEGYVRLGVELNFYTVLESARRRGEVALGYRIKAEAKEKERNYGVVLNPNKSERITFRVGDQIVVLAEEE